MARPEATFLALLLLATGACPALAAKHQHWPDSPLADETQVSLEKAGRLIKARKYEAANDVVISTLGSATDVPKCLAIANYCESAGNSMMETRRQCLNRALSLCNGRDDLLLVALKARQYQFFEITRQAVTSLSRNSRTVPDLYDLAAKAQELALNDVAHLAMEKAYTGLKEEKDAYTFANRARALGMDDLVRRVVKDMIDDENDSAALAELAVKVEVYGHRDLLRYCLRKGMDECNSVPGMQAVFEAARRLREPDIAARAQFFVKKGQLIQKMKEDRARYDAEMQAWREGVDVGRQRDALLDDQLKVEDASGFGAGHLRLKKSSDAPASGF